MNTSPPKSRMNQRFVGNRLSVSDRRKFLATIREDGRVSGVFRVVAVAEIKGFIELTKETRLHLFDNAGGLV